MATLSDNEQGILCTEHLRGLVIIKSSVNKEIVHSLRDGATMAMIGEGARHVKRYGFRGGGGGTSKYMCCVKGEVTRNNYYYNMYVY